MKKFINTQLGFTLTEVLITLGIIGVIAIFTIPSLRQGMEERATVTAVKKAYSTLSNAYKLAVQENGTPDTWGMSGWNSPQALDKLKPYLRVDKDCTDGSKGCFPAEVDYKILATSLGDLGVLDNSLNPKLKLADGMLILTYIYNPNCGDQYGSTSALQSVCGVYTVDINGYKNPNQQGKDVFTFWLTKEAIVPRGTAPDTAWNFNASCKDKDTGSGMGCAAWVIYNENMDYLHCNNLSWTGPTKCN